MARWATFSAEVPALAVFGEERMRSAPAYLATVREDGVPRVHPVTPIIGAGGLYLFMEPTSPKGRDLRERDSFALHNGVPDGEGSGGEFWIAGRAVAVEDPETRSAVAAASSYAPDDRYILFELDVREARCNAYGDVVLPPTTRWREPPPGS